MSYEKSWGLELTKVKDESMFIFYYSCYAMFMPMAVCIKYHNYYYDDDDVYMLYIIGGYIIYLLYSNRCSRFKFRIAVR